MSVFLSIVIPVHNETRRLPHTIERILLWLGYQKFSAELVIVENGSTDGTQALVRTLQDLYPALIRAYSIPVAGKGRAVQFGMLEARGSARYMCDCDLSTPMWDLNGMIRDLDTCDLVIGNRTLNPANRIGEPARRVLAGRVFNQVVQSLLLPGITDSQCGFKLFTAQAAADIFSRQTITGWAFDVEILYIARALGYQIGQAPVTWTADLDSRVNLIRDTLSMIGEITRIKSNAQAGIYERAPEPQEGGEYATAASRATAATVI